MYELQYVFLMQYTKTWCQKMRNGSLVTLGDERNLQNTKLFWCEEYDSDRSDFLRQEGWRVRRCQNSKLWCSLSLICPWTISFNLVFLFSTRHWMIFKFFLHQFNSIWSTNSLDMRMSFMIECFKNPPTFFKINVHLKGLFQTDELN